jgi:hypothetical protein
MDSRGEIHYLLHLNFHHFFGDWVGILIMERGQLVVEIMPEGVGKGKVIPVLN